MALEACKQVSEIFLLLSLICSKEELSAVSVFGNKLPKGASSEDVKLCEGNSCCDAEIEGKTPLQQAELHSRRRVIFLTLSPVPTLM